MRRLSHVQCAVSNRPEARLVADSKFRRYSPMDKHEVRQAQVTGTEIERLRQRRQMLLSMDPEKAKTVIEWHQEKLTFFQAFALAKREGKLIVPNTVHDRILTGTTDEEFLKQAYNNWKWTGTLVVYEALGIPFREQIVFTWEHNKIQHSVTFEIPEQFRGKPNCALVVEHPDFELINLGNNKYEIKLADEANVNLIKAFPKKNDWYLSTHGIPVGEVADSSNNNARYLWRDSNNYSGPVARGYGDFVYYRWHYVVLGVQPSFRFGVALF